MPAGRSFFSFLFTSFTPAPPQPHPGSVTLFYANSTLILWSLEHQRELSRKPQAVRQVAPELVALLGEPYQRLWALLEQTHGGRQAGRILAGILGAIDAHGETAVTIALTEALATGAFTTEGSGNLLALTRQLPPRPVLTEAEVPSALRAVRVEAGCAADYDLLLSTGVMP